MLTEVETVWPLQAVWGSCMLALEFWLNAIIVHLNHLRQNLMIIVCLRNRVLHDSWIPIMLFSRCWNAAVFKANFFSSDPLVLLMIIIGSDLYLYLGMGKAAKVFTEIRKRKWKPNSPRMNWTEEKHTFGLFLWRCKLESKYLIIFLPFYWWNHKILHHGRYQI